MFLLKKSQKYIGTRYGYYIQYQGISSIKKNLKQQRTVICIKIYGEIYEGIRNYKTTINIILSSNKQTNRED